MEEIVKYGYFNEDGEHCIVLNGNLIKSKFNAKKIYIDTEE